MAALQISQILVIYNKNDFKLNIAINLIYLSQKMSDHQKPSDYATYILYWVLFRRGLFSVGWLQESYMLATSKVISIWVTTCDSVYSMQIYSAAPLGNQAADTMT